MNSTRCDFGTNGLPYRSRHVVVLGFRMHALSFFASSMSFRRVTPLSERLFK